jgi:hypothetical protein
LTDSATSLSRPADLSALQVDLVELALGGAVAPEPGVRDWLEAIGVSRTTAGNLVVADEDWLACSLPSASADELLTRSLLRDPLYRLHVDLLVTEVVIAIGVSGRLSRLEDLVFGELAQLSPRLSALAELVRSRDGGWETSAWSSFDSLPFATAAEFDERCWGICGGAEAMFPVLRTRYPAFASVPVFLPAATPLTRSVLAAAAAGEAVRVPADDEADLTALARQGLPLWWRPLEGETLEVTLSTPCRARGEEEDPQGHPFSRGVPSLVRSATALLPSRADDTRPSFWEIAETSTSGLAFVGTASREAWPTDEDASRRGLPRGGDLSNLVAARRPERGSPDPADDAIRSLADHPLFGFWIQILLVEALDRELGEETLLFAPPTHAIVDDVEAATRVYYRSRPNAMRQVQALLELGTLDDVMTRVAVAVGVLPVAVVGSAAGPWSRSLALLARTGIAQPRHDRWALSPHALDRLHGGGLMTGVIRRGREFRERLHIVLEALWRERADSAKGTRSA